MGTHNSLISVDCKVRMKTGPGFVLESCHFRLEFLSAAQEGKLSHLLEYRTGWTDVMNILLATLEEFPIDIETVETVAKERLEMWALGEEGGQELQLKIAVRIYENKDYRTSPQKLLRLVFNDARCSVVMFDVKKKSVMRSLKTFASEAVSSRLVKKESIDELEIPKSLNDDLLTALNDVWRNRVVDKKSLKQKIAQQIRNDMKNKQTCPYCGRSDLRRLNSHIMRSRNCRLRHQMQLESEYIENECY